METKTLDNIAYQIVTIDAQIEHLKDEKSVLQQQLRDSIGEGNKQQTARFSITVSNPTKRLNAGRVEKAYPVEQNPQFYKTTLDTKTFKKAVSENELDNLDLFDYTTGRIIIKPTGE